MAETGFISQIVEQLLPEKENWVNHVLVIPNKRPKAFILREIQKHHQGVSFSPQIITIDELISKSAPFAVANQVQLVIEIWKIYSSIVPNNQLSIDKFYALGETMLNDFDNIDRALINATALFANIEQLKELEERFEPKEQIAKLKELWHQFSNEDLSSTKQNFKELWAQMGNIYHLLKQLLQSQNLAFGGMAARHVAENTECLSWLSGKKVWFCGFNALTNVEVKLMQLINDVATVKHYYDYDDFYYLDPKHEAGFFARKNTSIFKNELKPCSEFSQGQKEIQVKGLPGLTGMAQQMAIDIAQLQPEALSPKSAIVLADEKGLIRVLGAVPESVGHLNVTMGYPVWNDTYTAFIMALLQMHSNASKGSFYYKQVEEVLMQNDLFGQQKAASLLTEMKKGQWNYLASTTIIKYLPGHLHFLFHKIDETQCVKLYTELCKRALKELNLVTENNGINQQVLGALYAHFNMFYDALAEFEDEITPSLYIKLLTKSLKSTTTPFEGDPLDGLQLMGFLETRLLDFENLFVLSVNEGIIPKGVHYGSLIPFGIRKEFKLNTFEEDDAIYAYHFYRLLQRARHVSLYYNTDSGTGSKAEPSRFILQLEHELVKANSQIKFSKKVIGLSPKLTYPKPLVIAKTPDVYMSLSQYELENGMEKTRMLSPSALTTYIKAPLQFYLRYVANLQEPDEIEEDINPIILGQIVHGALEDLYQPYLGTVITKNLVENVLKPQVEELTMKHLNEQLKSAAQDLAGNNQLLLAVCQKLVQNVLENDANTDGLIIREVEFKKLDTPLEIDTPNGKRKIRLAGQFDRLDEVNGVTRVIDYKTGKVKTSAENDIQKIFENSDYSAHLQALFYAFVYLHNNPSKQIQPVIFTLKNGRDMVQEVCKEPIDLHSSVIVEFEAKLKLLLEEIWSKLPFENTDHEEQDKYLMIDVL
ncbi:MAG: PD-(D/E)XK nuclease family protein [Bacteroidetes bacterium]|nr:PD-(D/E)XK nuclease family protein [Bacteroidota bacterium]